MIQSNENPARICEQLARNLQQVLGEGDDAPRDDRQFRRHSAGHPSTICLHTPWHVKGAA